ncbi:MAG: hypothetical protein AAB795_00965 [Patescibacteria group bacterium]
MDPISIQPADQNNSKIWLIVSIVVVLIIIAFGFYFLRNSNIFETPSAIESINDINMLQKQGTSDDISAINADLQATDLNNLDKEVSAIDAEFDAAAK